MALARLAAKPGEGARLGRHGAVAGDDEAAVASADPRVNVLLELRSDARGALSGYLGYVGFTASAEDLAAELALRCGREGCVHGPIVSQGPSF